MIHRFIDKQGVSPRLPFVGFGTRTESGVDQDYYFVYTLNPNDPGDDWSYTDPAIIGVNVLPGDALADASVSPDGLFLLWQFMNSSGANRMEALSIEHGWRGQVGASQSSLLFTSQQPWWHPDQTGIVYRNIDDSPFESAIRTCDIDPLTGATSNDQAVLTVSRTTVGNLVFPTYSYDGSKIVYIVDKSSGAVNDELWVMNADGTGSAKLSDASRGNVDVGNAFSVANTANKVAYSKRITSTHYELRVINLDGTGDTLVYDDTQAFYGFSRKAWAHDDSELFFFKRISTTVDPQFQLWTVDPAGGGAAAVDAGNSDLVCYGSSNDDIAHVFGQRIYFVNTDWFNTDSYVLVSCLYDGSDVRVEADNASPPVGLVSGTYQGGGFFGFNNQPT